MSRIAFQTRGMGSLIRDMDGFMDEYRSRIAEDINVNGENVVTEARNNHRFNTRSGSLERSVTFELSRVGGSYLADIYLDDTFTSTGSGKSYGTFIHEGTYQGYSQSPIGEGYSSSTSASGSGWQADQFLWNAFESKWRLRASILKTQRYMRRRYERP